MDEMNRSNARTGTRARVVEATRPSRGVFVFTSPLGARTMARERMPSRGRLRSLITHVYYTKKSARRDAESAGENVGLERVENDRR